MGRNIIPRFVAEWIDHNRETSFARAFHVYYEYQVDHIEELVHDWLHEKDQNIEKFLAAWNGDYEIKKDYYVIRTGEDIYLERLEISTDNPKYPITKVNNTIDKAVTFTTKENAEKTASLVDGILEEPF